MWDPADLNPSLIKRHRISGVSSTNILDTTKSHRRGPVQTWRHQQVLAMLRQPIRLRKIPARPLRLIMAAPSENGGTSVRITVLIRPLPNIAHQIHHPESAAPTRVSIGIARWVNLAARYWAPEPPPDSSYHPMDRPGRPCLARHIATPIHAAAACPPISSRRARLRSRPR